MIGGIYFAGAPFAGVLRAAGQAAAALAGAATITFTSAGQLDAPPPYLAGDATIVFTTSGNLTVPIDTTAGISIGGVDVTGRVRVNGLTVHDILNDAPNTATFTIEGDAPAVGQRVRIVTGNTLLFTGAVQTIDQAFESLPKHLAWRISAIDDTAEANARRPFGTWFDTSATTIAQSMTTTFAPAFATTGIEAGLPNVTIVFDGADPFIQCLSRLATAVGGYCKIEDHVVYLFTEDTTAPPDPIDDAHRFLMSPPVTVNTDSSQLRTRVYGKGYGETVPADINAGETLLPIQDGALFPPLGGTAIVGLTPEGAQSDKIAFTGVVPKSGGSLVGTGSSPTTAPIVALAGGAGVTSGAHTLTVAYRTAAGQSLAGPVASITAGTHPPPATAPTASAAINGTGPDQGSHDYAASFVTAYGETVAGAISNPVTTSAASGQIPSAGACTPSANGPHAGNVEIGSHRYTITFTNATGETALLTDAGVTTAVFGGQGSVPPIVGPPVGTTGGNLTPATRYFYVAVFVTGNGETTGYGITSGGDVTLTAAQNAVNLVGIPTGDANVTGRRIYRHEETFNGSWSSGQFFLVATINNNGATTFLDTMAQTSAATGPSRDYTHLVTVSTAGPRTIPITNIGIGAAGTTGRKIYRSKVGTSDPYFLVAAIGNNTQTTYDDTKADAALGAQVPLSNTTGTAVQRVPVSNIPIGPPGVTSRNLYRRFNGAGAFRLVTTLANNSTTTFNDSVANASLGAASLGTATAVGNQLAVTLPIGASAVTARELYMSPVSGPRRLIQTVADNTTTALTVTIADGAITGALEPTADTSGLQQPNGQVNPGSPTLPVAASAPFRAAGGWVTLGGGQVVRFTGISGNTLTGIPATGSGAITTAVIYGQQAIPAPMLIGVTGLARPMLKGSAVHIWVQRDDTLAQSEQAARTGGSGIVEFLIVDNRRGVDSLVARCDADLALFSRPIVTVGYATRDLKTKSGKPIVINLPSQRLATTLTIQDVTITEIDIATGLAPRFTVRASSVRFSLEDTLRRLIAGGQTEVNA